MRWAVSHGKRHRNRSLGIKCFCFSNRGTYDTNNSPFFNEQGAGKRRLIRLDLPFVVLLLAVQRATGKLLPDFFP